MEIRTGGVSRRAALGFSAADALAAPDMDKQTIRVIVATPTT